MKKISIDNIKDNMVLAKDIIGTSGSVLLAKGTVLNASIGKRLKNWGVLFVTVEGEDEDIKSKGENVLSPEEVRKNLEEKFADVISNEIMKKIFSAVYKFKIKHNI
jgi:hypothetical protein